MGFNLGSGLFRVSIAVGCFFTLALYNNCSSGFESSADNQESSSFLQAWACENSQVGMQEKNGRRLTNPEIIRSLDLIFGSEVLALPNVRDAILTFPRESIFGQFNEFDKNIHNVEGLLTIAEAIATEVVSSASLKSKVLGCSSNMNQCYDNLISNLGRSLYHRPLTLIEQNALRALMTDIGGDDGLRWGIAFLILSPHFHQSLEAEDSQVVGQRVKLSQYEVALRIALRTTGAVPDSELLNEAAQGKLSTLASVQKQAERLILTRRGRDFIKDRIKSWLAIQDVGDPHTSAALEFGIDPVGLGKEAESEFGLFLDEIIFNQNGNYQDLLTNKSAFANTDRMARLYGLPQSNSVQKFNDERGGILLRAATLISSKPWSDPILRGTYLRRRVLCQNLPFPSSSIVQEREMDLEHMDRSQYSSREIVTEVTSPARCMACHSKINPLGFPLEGFGTLGERRDVEKVFATNGNVIANHPIDTAVANININPNESTPVQNAEQLVAAISDSPQGKRCFIEQVFAQTQYRFPNEADGCVLNAIRESVVQGHSVKESFIKSVANDDIFWRKRN